MIFGIGTDIVAVARMGAFFERHGERGLAKLLAPEERPECRASGEPARFLAKRFAAKEALSKALGTGMRTPVRLTEIAVVHDGLGKPMFRFGPALDPFVAARGLTTHLSITDERDYAVAFVVAEKP